MPASAARPRSVSAANPPYAASTWNQTPRSRHTAASSPSGSTAPVLVVPAGADDEQRLAPGAQRRRRSPPPATSGRSRRSLVRRQHAHLVGRGSRSAAPRARATSAPGRRRRRPRCRSSSRPAASRARRRARSCWPPTRRSRARRRPPTDSRSTAGTSRGRRAPAGSAPPTASTSPTYEVQHARHQVAERARERPARRDVGEVAGVVEPAHEREDVLAQLLDQPVPRPRALGRRPAGRRALISSAVARRSAGRRRVGEQIDQRVDRPVAERAHGLAVERERVVGRGERARSGMRELGPWLRSCGTAAGGCRRWRTESRNGVRAHGRQERVAVELVEQRRVEAVTVAVRGTSRSSAISPTKSPGPRSAAASRALDAALPSATTYTSRRVALAHEDRARGRPRPRTRGATGSRRSRSAAARTRAPSAARGTSPSGTGLRPRGGRAPPSAGHDQQRRQAPAATRPPRAPEQRHERGREQRADPGGDPVRALDDRERAAEHLVRRQALEQRQPGGLDQRVAHAQHDEQRAGQRRSVDAPRCRSASSADQQSARRPARPPDARGRAAPARRPRRASRPRPRPR